MDTEALNRPSGAPSPVVVAMNEGMWLAASEGRLDLQRCTSCGIHRYPPAVTCLKCHSIEWEWSTLPGTGTVFTYSWVPDRKRSAEQESEVLYNVAVIELDGVEGGPVRMMSNVVDAWERGDLDVGQAVEVVGVRVDGDVTLPCFRRVR
jgi:uncharacterized OB-fold protein